MTVNCEAIADEAGSGVAAALRAVDCAASNITADAFGRLFAPGGQMATVLTILLTLYVAIFGFLLLTGRAGVGVRSLIPRAMTLGLVLTFATSWVAYQSVVWNLAVGAPDWLAGLLMGGGAATQTFAEKIDVVFAAIQEASQGASDISAFSPPGMMWMGAMLFMLGTLGLLVTARIALAVLIALGPIFVVMALFEGTRGLFAGWVKGLVMLALTPLFAVLGGSIMLELAVPILGELVSSPGQVPAQAAMGFLMIGAVHIALMVLVLKTAGTMVGGWTVFGLASKIDDKVRKSQTPSTAPVVATPAVQASQEASQSIAAARRIDISAPAYAAPANDGGGSPASAQTAATNHASVTRATSGEGQAVPVMTPSRTHGLGSRFRAPNTRLETKR